MNPGKVYCQAPSAGEHSLTAIRARDESLVELVCLQNEEHGI